MYLQFESFQRDAKACGTGYYTDRSLSPESLQAAYAVYRTARQGTTLDDFDNHPVTFGVTIVGRLALRGADGSWVPSNENFPSIDQILMDNLTTMDGTPGKAGAILDARHWSLLANDAWLLGGIHAQTEFHFASPLCWTNLWADSPGRLSITAREAIGILSFGYQGRRPYPNMEAVAICTDPVRARAANLLSYRDEILKIRDEAAARTFLRSLPEFLTR